MAQETMRKEEARDRIIHAAVALFSEKGYDGTRVNEIADMAGVNKALIYYYFKNKEDILDYLLQNFYDDLKNNTLSFIQEHIVHMIVEGRLDIEAERFHFTTQEDARAFIEAMRAYYKRFLQYVLANKHIIRIQLLESMKSSKHNNDVFHFYELMKMDGDNPLFKTIYEADQDFAMTAEWIEFKFFFFIVPFLNFAAYYDEWKRVRGLSDDALQASFIRALDFIVSSVASGQDIIIPS